MKLEFNGKIIDQKIMTEKNIGLDEFQLVENQDILHQNKLHRTILWNLKNKNTCDEYFESI